MGRQTCADSMRSSPTSRVDVWQILQDPMAEISQSWHCSTIIRYVTDRHSHQTERFEEETEKDNQVYSHKVSEDSSIYLLCAFDIPMLALLLE